MRECSRARRASDRSRAQREVRWLAEDELTQAGEEAASGLSCGWSSGSEAAGLVLRSPLRLLFHEGQGVMYLRAELLYFQGALAQIG